MRLQDYERAPDIRGIHGVASYSANFDHDWWIDRIREMGMAWCKVIDDSSGAVCDFAKKLRRNGVMLIVHIFQDAPLPDGLPQKALDTISRYMREGATRRLEIHSEPNLPLDGIM